MQYYNTCPKMKKVQIDYMLWVWGAKTCHKSPIFKTIFTIRYQYFFLQNDFSDRLPRHDIL